MKKENKSLANTIALFRISGLFHEVANMQSATMCDCSKITVAQAKMIECVFADYYDGISLKDLARELGVTPGAASQTLDSLVKIGLMDRCVNENDRRSVVIRPSELGKESKIRMDEISARVFDRIASDISESDMNTFNGVLSKIYEDLKRERNYLRGSGVECHKTSN